MHVLLKANDLAVVQQKRYIEFQFGAFLVPKYHFYSDVLLLIERGIEVFLNSRYVF